MQLHHDPMRAAAAVACAVSCACHATPSGRIDRASSSSSSSSSRNGAGTTARIAFAGALAPLDGSRLRVSVVEVRYGPGEGSPPHSHPCPVVGYVAAGAIRTRTLGGAESVHHAGDTFYEAPNGVHLISANASTVEPATLVATFICDRDTTLSVAAPRDTTPGTDPR